MREAQEAFSKRGWIDFGYDADIAAWARACKPAAERLARDPAHAQWHRCDGTWFAGVNVLENDGRGAVPDEAIPPLSGKAVTFVTEGLGHRGFAWDAAQISIVYPGYPRQGSEETDAAWRYRVRRCAAHVDGLERIMPERRRKLSETHGFVLGLPLGNAGREEGAFVVWEGSQELMREAFLAAFGGLPPEQWRDLDITDVYTETRARCFDECEAVEVAPGLGHAYVVHPLALHGVAPWRGAENRPPRIVAYFRPDPFNGDPVKWLTA